MQRRIIVCIVVFSVVGWGYFCIMCCVVCVTCKHGLLQTRRPCVTALLLNLAHVCAGGGGVTFCVCILCAFPMPPHVFWCVCAIPQCMLDACLMSPLCVCPILPYIRCTCPVLHYLLHVYANVVCTNVCPDTIS